MKNIPRMKKIEKILTALMNNHKLDLLNIPTLIVDDECDHASLNTLANQELEDDDHDVNLNNFEQVYNNETLEFLGDAVISAVVARYLLERFHGQNEGFLTKMRTKLVNGEMLGNLARQLGFGEIIIISRHIEDKCNGRTNPNILEDSFEAFVGAMFLDFNEVDNYNLLDNFYTGIGFQICEKFLINVYEDLVNFTDLIMTNTNYKEQLGRYFNETHGHSVRYGELSVTGISTEREHTCCVFVPNYDPTKLEDGAKHKDENIFVTATGTSRKKAEQAAAKLALQELKII